MEYQTATSAIVGGDRREEDIGLSSQGNLSADEKQEEGRGGGNLTSNNWYLRNVKIPQVINKKS